MKKIAFLVLAIVCVFNFLLTPGLVLAQTTSGSIGSEELGLFYGTTIGLTTTDVRVTIASIIRTALGLLGIVAVLIVIYGGVLWMIAGGDEGKVDKAKKLMLQGVIGLAIILAAFAIATFVINTLVEAGT